MRDLTAHVKKPTYHVHNALEQIHAIASAAPRFYRLGEHDDAHLSPAELAEQYHETCEAPGDDEYDRLYAYAVWDAVNKKWVDDAV